MCLIHSSIQFQRHSVILYPVPCSPKPWPSLLFSSQDWEESRTASLQEDSYWTPEGRRKRPKETWVSVEEEIKSMSLTWEGIQKIAQDRPDWRNFVAAFQEAKQLEIRALYPDHHSPLVGSIFFHDYRHTSSYVVLTWGWELKIRKGTEQEAHVLMCSVLSAQTLCGC